MAEATQPTSPIAVGFKLGTATAPPVNLGGATVNVPASPATALQSAIDASVQGDTLVVPAAAVYNGITLPVRSGAGWTRIRSDGALPAFGTTVTPSDAAQLFKLLSAGGASSMSLSPAGPTQGWHIIGAECTHPNNGVGQARNVHFQAGACSRIIFERCYIHPASATHNCARGFWMEDVSDWQVWDSWVVAHCAANVADLNSAETQAFFIRRGARYHIEHNEVQATTENIVIGDQFSGSAALDGSILRNHLFKPLSWKLDDPSSDNINWLVKNSFETKFSTRTLFKGNTVENNWIGGDQPGDMFVINAGHQPDGTDAIAVDFLCESNEFINSPQAFAVNQQVQGGVNNTRVKIHNNLFRGIQNKSLSIGHACNDLWIEHNTIVLAVASSGSHNNHIIVGAPDRFPNFTFRRNIYGGAQYGTFLSGVDSAGSPTQGNWDTYLAGRVIAENAELAGPNGPPASGTALYPDGPGSIRVFANAAAAGINATTGVLDSTSPLKAGGANAGSDGKDLGVDFDDLAAAQDDLPPPPQIPVANFTYTPTLGTFTIQFTDLSANLPTTWAWSGPDGFSSTQANPSFTFPTSGNKLITLVASNALGSSAPVMFQITVPALPGFTHAQTTIGPYGATLRVDLPNLTAGNLLVVHVVSAIGATPVTITGVTDQAGNTYTPVNAGGTLTGAQEWKSRSFYTVVTTGSGSVIALNATLTGTNPQARLIASEYLPHLGAITFVGSPPMQSGGGPSPMDSGALTTPATGGALLLGFTDYDAAAVTTPTGWTNRGPANTVAEKLDPTVSTTYRFQPTFTGTQNWLAQLAIFASGVSGGPPDTTAPTVPTGLAHDAPVPPSGGRLTWLPSFDAVGVVNYDVARDSVGVTTVTTPEFTDAGLQQATTYQYTVRARDAAGNVSAFSAAHPITTGTIEPGTFLPPRFMRGFGVTRGAGPTDVIQTPDLGHGAQRTITCVLRLDDFGVLQSVFTKASEAVQSHTESLIVTTAGTLQYRRQWSTGMGAWSVPVPSLGVRHFLAIRMDTSNPANVPTIKLDNIQQTVTVVTQPTSGVAMQNTPGYMLGNVPGGSSFVLHGDLGRFAVFNFITTDLQDAALFAANDPLGIGAGAVQYIQLDGSSGEPDMVAPFAPSVVTGTQTQDYDPGTYVTVKSAGRTMTGWVR